MTFNHKKYQEIKKFIKKTSVIEDIFEPTIVAVTKTHSVEDIKTALDLGVKHFGEIRVQEASNKFRSLKNYYKNLKIHMIGPLQTNKVKKALNVFDFFHSLDRENLAKEFSKHSKKLSEKTFFIQVNTGSEIQKSGIQPSLVSEFTNYCLRDLKLNVVGYMCLPPVNDDPKKHFTMLNKIAETNNLKHLSMGMSEDYEIAIECGATYIRIGSILFGGRK